MTLNQKKNVQTLLKKLTNCSASLEELLSISQKKSYPYTRALIPPHLEYCIQFRSPYYKKNINKLESIQRRITKMISKLRNKSYEERLKELNLYGLFKRRLRGDLIEVMKTFHVFHSININDYVTTDLTSTTRNNGFKIIVKRFKSNDAKNIFFNRIVNV